MVNDQIKNYVYGKSRYLQLLVHIDNAHPALARLLVWLSVIRTSCCWQGEAHLFWFCSDLSSLVNCHSQSVKNAQLQGRYYHPWPIIHGHCPSACFAQASTSHPFTLHQAALQGLLRWVHQWAPSLCFIPTSHETSVSQRNRVVVSPGTVIGV